MGDDNNSHSTGTSEGTLLASGSWHPTPESPTPPPKSPKSKSKSRSKSRSRSKSKSKSPGKHKSKKSKSKVKNFGWWDLENDPELIAALEAEGLREKARIAEDEALMARRQEIVRKFMQQHIDDMEEDEAEKRAAARTKGVAQRFLQQVQQKERETKPVILKTVRAAPLKIDVSKWEAPKYKKDADEKALIKNYTKKHFLFKDRKDYLKQLSTTRSQKSNLNTGIASNTVAMMIKAFEPVKIDKGEAIIQQGTLDQHLYVIDNGAVEFQVDDATVATGGAGTAFGDQNLLHSEPAKKTVVATEDTKVFRLHQDTYRCILQQRHIVEDLKKQQKEKEKERAKEKLMREKERKEKQLSQGRESDEMKIKIEEETKAKEIEESKLEEEEEEWWKDEKSAQLQLAIRDALQKVHQDELEKIRVLGEGQFGEVWLVAANLNIEEDDDESKRYEFALKLQDTYDEYREETALSEIKVMKEVSGYPFVSMLYRSYETEESKDMLLGLIPGGELWDTIHQEDEETGEWLSGLSEGQSRFYALLVADTLDYLHSKHYVFRDLKPENIMLDGWGYPMIVDFGFCKRLAKGPNDKTFTFCGTPNYVSPEIVLNIGHNGAADCWALGIVIYEMIAGINPFFWDDMDQVELYRSICEDAGEPLSEKHHSRQVRKLVDALLVKDPDKRLNAKGIMKHGWFEGLSLQKMRKRQVRAPWIPPGGEGETAEYYCDYTEDEATAADRKREEEIEEELQRLKKKEEEERMREEEEEELERLRLLAEEQERLEEEERLREEEERRIREETEKLKKLEEELRLQKEEQERLQKETELQRQKELEEELLRAEEERLRLEEEERLREEEEEQLRLEEEERLREEEEERLRQEEEARIKMEEEQLRIEEEERLRVEEELRLQKEVEEELRREEEKRLRKLEELRLQRELEEKEKKKREKAERKKEQKRLKILEEQQRRDEEEERQRKKELRRQRMLEERAKEEEEEERQRQLEEEEERLRLELEEEQQKLKEEERRQREITLRRRREMNELEQEIEEKEQEDQQRRLHNEEQRQREVAARRRMRLEAEMQKHEQKVNKEEKAWRHRRQNVDDSEFFAKKVNSWEQSPVRRGGSRSFRNMADVSPVPKGYVSNSIKEYATRSPQKEVSQSPGALDVQKSVKRGIVAQRLNEAKRKEDLANVPSLFASFSLLEKNKKDRKR